jgi:hypothetical protein
MRTSKSRPTTGISDESGTYFRFRQNVQDSCGLNLCLLDFVGCCDCTPSAGDPFSDVERASMAELRAKCGRPRECASDGEALRSDMRGKKCL